MGPPGHLAPPRAPATPQAASEGTPQTSTLCCTMRQRRQPSSRAPLRRPCVCFGRPVAKLHRCGRSLDVPNIGYDWSQRVPLRGLDQKRMTFAAARSPLVQDSWELAVHQAPTRSQMTAVASLAGAFRSPRPHRYIHLLDSNQHGR